MTEFHCATFPRDSISAGRLIRGLVTVELIDGDTGDHLFTNLSPSDARAFAAEILRLADERDPPATASDYLHAPLPFKEGDEIRFVGESMYFKRGGIYFVETDEKGRLVVMNDSGFHSVLEHRLHQFALHKPADSGADLKTAREPAALAVRVAALEIKLAGIAQILGGA